MALKKFRKPHTGNGSASQKIVDVNSAQGFKGIQNQQGTTRVIMDAVQIVATTTNTTITLFEGCKTRQFPLTNLTENKLQIGESIAIQRFSLFIIECAAATTNVQGVLPLAYFPEFQRLYASFLSFNIAQDQVIKKLPLEGMYAPFNKNSRFVGEIQFQPASGALSSFEIPHDIYYLDNNIIIPQQIEFYASLLIPPITLPTGSGTDYYLGMKIEGLGSLYAPQSNY